MNPRQTFSVSAILGVLLLCSGVQAADEVPGSVLDQLPGYAFGVPKRGQHMSHVRYQLGDPVRIRPWVGDPPITRWIYPRFTVYFQEWRVIGVVANRPGEGATFRMVERNE